MRKINDGLTNTQRYTKRHPGRVAARSKRWDILHPERAAARWKRWALAHPEQFKKSRAATQLRQRYGPKAPEHKATQLRKQNSRCAICLRRFAGMEGVKVCLDHRGKVLRGVLCHPCNTGIAMLQESTRVLKNAITYLRKWGFA